ncbi:odorant receptor 4 [Manduca sexta]|uniref:odorant receptor 4 n=1 Tax=Manduca sexta TaxID=7130 RepID=UPI00188E4BD3|nr:odorant receptor 4 [Manduca sexta]
MGWIERIKGIVLKKSFDFDRPDICLYNFHPQLRILFALKGIFFNKQNSKLRFILPTYFNLLTILGMVFEGMFVHRGLTIKDYSFAIESFLYFIILTSTPLIYSCLFYHKDKIIQLLNDMNEEFKFVCSLGPRHRTPFLKGQLLIWKLCYAWHVLSISTGTMFMLFPVMALVYQTLFVTHTENTIRPLAFVMWLPNDDPYRTPNYELFLFFEMNYCVIIVQTFGVYIYILFHLLLHHYFILDMMILDFEAIFDGLDESVAALPSKHPRRREVQLILNARIKRIVTWHNSVIKTINTMSKVYKVSLTFQILLSSIMMCLIGYQIAESLDNGVIDFLFIMLGVCGCMQVWVPCYLGTLLRNKVFTVREACWNCGWHKNSLGTMIRLDLLIIIQRTQVPLLIKVSGISTLELETFSSIMSAAYSYFNMLRNSN